MKEIRHTGIVVSNMEQSLKFYHDILCMKIVKDFTDEGEYIDSVLGLSGVHLRMVKLTADDGSMVELLQYISHPNKPPIKTEIYDLGCTHIAFTVENLDKEYERLSEKGVKFNCKPYVSPDGYAKVAFCHDPDGTSIELVEVLNSSANLPINNYLATVYDEESHPYTKYPSQLCKYLFNRFNMERGQKLVDIGCGRGDFLCNFKKLGLNASGVDLEYSPSDFLKDIDVRYVDIERDSIPFDDETFDVVFSKSVIEHMNDPENCLREAYRILKPGGVAIIMAPDWISNMKIYFDDHTHRTPFTVDSMRDALKMFGFIDVNAELFYQLPILWKYPSLKLLSWTIRFLLPVTLKSKMKFIRWSSELMVLGYGIKKCQMPELLEEV